MDTKYNPSSLFPDRKNLPCPNPRESKDLHLFSAWKLKYRQRSNPNPVPVEFDTDLPPVIEMQSLNAVASPPHRPLVLNSGQI